MRVKRYVVDSMPDALQRIRADLGKDAIIINTKNIKTGGIFGLFAKKQIEVIAAIDAHKTTEPLQRPVSTPTIIKKEEHGKEPIVYDLKSVVSKRLNPPANSFDSAVNEEQASAAITNTMIHSQPVMAEEKKEELIRPKSKPLINFTPLRLKLEQQGVDEELIADILSTVETRYPAALLQSEQSIIQHAKLVVEDLLGRAKKSGVITKESKFLKFFGPTGVGKTTTIAKLAAEAVLKNKRKVGLITTDTYRIGAVEQLRTYANILNVPLEVVFQPMDMEIALEKLKLSDLNFMDTAGRNYRNQDNANELIKFFPHINGTLNYLVLSLTAKNHDMIDIIKNFQHIDVESVIFTKADETRTYGSILNMVCRYNLSLSYITTGQNVPDDILVASPSKVANLILGEDHYV
jgi:flagellar biosynthesis protein FlhF